MSNDVLSRESCHESPVRAAGILILFQLLTRAGLFIPVKQARLKSAEVLPFYCSKNQDYIRERSHFQGDPDNRTLFQICRDFMLLAS